MGRYCGVLILEEFLVLYKGKESTGIIDGLHNFLKDYSKYHTSNCLCLMLLCDKERYFPRVNLLLKTGVAFC